MVHLSWTKNFLVKTILITFIFLLVLFIVQNLKKLLQQIQNYDNALFLDQNWSICPNFFWIVITIIVINLLATFIVQNVKEIIPVDPELWECANPELWRCATFGPKVAHFPKWKLFQKTSLRALFLLCTCQTDD